MSTATRRGGSEFLDLIGSSSGLSLPNTGRLRYDTATQKFQVSLNGAAYVDVSTGGGGGMSIGDTVTGGTTGSVLFVGAGSVLAQDNAKFFWDDTNNRLGIGTASPIGTAHIVGGSNVDALDVLNTGLTGQTVNQAIISGTNSATYNTTAGSLNAYAYYGDCNVSRSAGANNLFAIGARFRARGGQVNQALRTDEGDVVLNIVNGTTAVSYMTTGSVFFAGASGVVSQDNANFFWNDTNNRLGIGNAAPTQALHVTGTGRFTAGILLDTLTTGSILFSGASGAVSQDNANLFWDDTNNRLGLGTNVPGTVLDIAGTGNTAGLALRGGSSTVVSAAGSARIRFNEGTNTLQASLNGGAYSDIGGVSNPTWLTVGDRATHALDAPVKVVSAFEFDRSQFTSSTIKFRATGARGNTVNGVVELYNLTDAASVTTLTFSSTSPALQESADITGSLPASSKIYEVRIYLAAPFIAGDSIELYSAYLNLAP